jgi:hypothetical protein
MREIMKDINPIAPPKMPIKALSKFLQHYLQPDLPIVMGIHIIIR